MKSENSDKILEATIKVFNQKGLKFTMDDIATELGMSKKTIYATFRDKESMFLGMVDYCFDRIKIQKQLVLEDETLSTVEKIRKVLGAAIILRNPPSTSATWLPFFSSSSASSFVITRPINFVGW